MPKLNLVMPRIINVAPQGDLVVAIGQGPGQKLVRISAGIIKYASPVFNTMLGPSFKEGQSAHDACNPLKLPDDDPTSTLSLFHILHYNSSKVNTTAKYWLQKLVQVCDKYQCISKVKEYISFRLKDRTWRAPSLSGDESDDEYDEDESAEFLKSWKPPKVHKPALSSIDIFTIAGMVGDHGHFEGETSRVVRMTEENARAGCHEDLLPLLPEDMLERMKAYRLRQRAAYRDNIQTLVAKIFLANGLRNFDLCPALQKRLALFYKTLFKADILPEPITADRYLDDLGPVLRSEPFDYDTSGKKGIDRFKCTRDCQGCTFNLGAAARDASQAADIKVCPKVCLKCFQQREFNFLDECTKHNNQAK